MSAEGQVRLTSLKRSSPRVSTDGRLVFARGNTLWSVPFDLDQLEVSGDPEPILDGVYYSNYGHYDISREGSLVFRRDSAHDDNSLVWVDHHGNDKPTPLAGARYRAPGISPDGDLIAISEYSAYGPDLWTHSLSRGEPTQWTFEESGETNPVWSYDSADLYFERGIPTDIYRIALDGAGDVERLTDTQSNLVPRSVTPNGRYLIIDEWVDSGGDRNNIGVLDLSNNAIQGESDIEYLIQTDYRESHPKLSPDGKLLAYVSDRSGSLEIWVRGQPFADEESIRVSVSGDCRQPLWNTDSRELFYWDWDDDIIYSVQLDTSPELRAAQPVPLFSAEPYVFDSMGNYNYDRSRNMLLMIKKPPPGSKGNEIVLVENWQEIMTRD